MVFDAFERMVAFRYLRARRKEGFISVIAGFSLLGIGLGVATLIVVMAVMNGFRQELLSRILGLNGHVGVYGAGPSLPDFDPLTVTIRGLPGVIRAIPTVEGQVMVTAPGGASGAMVRGVRPDDLLARDVFKKGMHGAVEAFQGADAVMLGRRLAEKLGVGIGDSVTLISPKGIVTAFGSVPRMRAYHVVATFEVGMYEYDSSFIFMPLEAAQTYFQMPGQVSQIEVFAENPDKVGDIRLEIFQMAGGANLRVYDWQQANSSFFNAIQVERNVMFLILSLIVVVATLNIVSGLILLVRDKSSDIAILRTMGATPGTIMRVFLINGALIGVVGTLSGLGLGILITLNIKPIQHVLFPGAWDPTVRFLAEIPAQMNPKEITAVVVTSLLLSLAATLYPSWRAARLDPVQALRYG